MNNVKRSDPRILLNILSVACILTMNKYVSASFCPVSYQILGPVCGTDGVTYPSMCDLESARLLNNRLDVALLKPCNNYCNEQWEPLCGTDMVTYSNFCMFEHGQEVNPDLKVLHIGQCMSLYDGNSIQREKRINAFNNNYYNHLK
ncbi:hypothetical protein HF086_017026 [Spodoptera exigua]|uniref:Kazal-like domain-containing protein n=1 Tax=Spodoptera exigua TaxID=7107 RepID=A0A922MHW5_SPOEX|nr:hypothetical protein HF086_017026 [Spodoptera exigua]